MASNDNTVEGVVSQIDAILARIDRAMRMVVSSEADKISSVDRAYLMSAFNENTGHFFRLEKRLLWLSDNAASSEKKRVRSEAERLRKTFKVYRDQFFNAFPDAKIVVTGVPKNSAGIANSLGPITVNQIRQAVNGGGRPVRKAAFTQKAVAALLGIKCGAATIANWERERTKKRPHGYSKELRVNGEKPFFDFVAEYLRTHDGNERLKQFLRGKVVYTEGLTEKQIGLVQAYAQDLAQMRYS